MGCGVAVGQHGSGSGRGKLVVRDIGTQRESAAGRAMTAAGEELGQILSPAVAQAMWAELFGVRVLRADDAHGRGQGLVVQHDEILWADLLELALFATPAVETLGHPQPTCALDGTCGPCRVVRALGRSRSTWLSSGMTLPGIGAPHLAPGERTGDAAWAEARPNGRAGVEPPAHRS